MMDENIACLRTHRNNIARYRRLLQTKLTDLERQFIERRLSEEQSYYERLAAGTLEFRRLLKSSQQLTRLSKARQERSRNRWR